MIAARFKELSVEEVANSLTHGFGLLLSLAGAAFLLFLAAYRGDAMHFAAAVVYGASLVILYAASTIYHSTSTPEFKRKLQIVDHCCIYLLIAGSYTPFALVVLDRPLGVGLLAVIWAIAAFGIAMKIVFRSRFNAAGIASYLVMGWLGVLAVQPLYLALGLVPLVLVVAGGVSYSLGMVFFGWKSIRHHHAIFHLFVLAGSIIHYFAIAIYVIG